MKKLFLFLLTVGLVNAATAQNVGIGTTEPLNKLQINGSVLVNTPVTSTNTAPTAAQEITMVNAVTVSFTASDSTGRIYDPGGPAANYPANVTSFANIASAVNCIGIEVTVEAMQLGTGDSLIIKETSGSSDTLRAAGNG